MQIKVGTRIEFLKGSIETAVIKRKTKLMGNIPAGFYPVRFDEDGACLLVHESNFRVISNH